MGQRKMTPDRKQLHNKTHAFTRVHAGKTNRAATIGHVQSGERDQIVRLSKS